MKSSKTPRAPSHFSDKTRQLWRQIHDSFELEPDATETLRVALENLDLADIARAQLRDEGLIRADGRRHPASDICKQCDSMFLRSMRALGLDIVKPNSGEPAGRRT